MSEELREALKDLLDVYHMGDWIYHVRENADMTDFEGSSWEHPRVKRYGEIVEIILRAITEESGE